MIAENKAFTQIKAALAEEDGRRQHIGFTEFFFKLKEIDRIIGMLQVGDKLLFRGFSSPVVRSELSRSCSISMSSISSIPPSSSSNGLPVRAKDLFKNPVMQADKKEKVRICQEAGSSDLRTGFRSDHRQAHWKLLLSRGSVNQGLHSSSYPRSFCTFGSSLWRISGILSRKPPFDSLLQAGSHRAARQFVDLDRGLKPLDLGFKLGIMLVARPG